MASFPSLSRQAWPRDPQELDAFYGDPRGPGGGASPAWEAANLVTFAFPWRIKGSAQGGRIHRKVKPSLDRVLAAIWDQVGREQTAIAAHHLDEFGGSYVFRVNRNDPSRLSNHARGIAIDLAPEENPNRQAWVEDATHLPRFVIEAFKAEGWRWGGDFSTTKDAMHFEAVFDQHHDQPPVPAPKPGPMPAPAPPPIHLPPIGDDLIGEVIRRWAIAKTGLPAEVDRFKADLLAQVMVLAAKIQAFTLEPAPGEHRDGGSVPRPLPFPLPLPLPLPLPAPGPAPAPAPANVQRDIIATVFGGRADVNESAYDGHVISDDEPGCALPFHFAGVRPMVVIAGPNGRTVTVPIVDVGPIYPSKRGPADPYWETNARPRAETGRVLSQAGIDLTPKTARDVGIDGKGKVDWYFPSQTGETKMSNETWTPGTSNNQIPNVPSFLINWKTTAAGAVPMLLALADLLNQLTSGHLDPNHLYADIGALSVGLGLVGASDARKS